MNQSNQGKHPVRSATIVTTLRDYTPARVALDTTGCSLTTRHALEFALAHAQARDAVHSAMDTTVLETALRERELTVIAVRSAAADRTEYLRRPDLGRTLSADSASLLALEPVTGEMQRATSVALSLVLADGLSAEATNRHAVPLLDELLPLLNETWRLTPIVLAEQARVALGDSIGQALHAEVTVMLIGERPGLSSADSLGAYITWSPRPGRSDAERNCVSNIRAEGLDYAGAAAKIAWYLGEGRRLGLTGVAIRESDRALLP